jgi:hypothetical protein
MGTAPDVLIMAAPALDDLIRQGKAVPGPASRNWIGAAGG